MAKFIHQTEIDLVFRKPFYKSYGIGKPALA